MESRNFPQIGTEFLRGKSVGNDVGYLTEEMGYTNPGPTPNLRGVERNTARGVKESVVLTGITPVEYAAATDAPEVVPFDTYEDD